ncbi:MAG: CoA-binding protein [Bacteroidales bacterium]|nr:CoA-binding protein [Bacteroidales bacterium]
MTKKTLVIGGSTKPERYSRKAIIKLRRYNFPVVSVGLRAGEVEGVNIETGFPDFKDIHTVTLYLGAKNQPAYYNYLLGLQPKRIIFNPGAENEELKELAVRQGIECIEDCTLIMLGEGSY